jgi:hypothetical protein
MHGSLWEAVWAGVATGAVIPLAWRVWEWLLKQNW